jgi:hypothetical protein
MGIETAGRENNPGIKSQKTNHKKSSSANTIHIRAFEIFINLNYDFWSLEFHTSDFQIGSFGVAKT